MSRRRNAYLATSLVASLLALPSLGLAATGGAGLGLVNVSLQSGVAQFGEVTVSASGNGIAISTRASALLSRELRFSGTVSNGGPGDVVEIERLGAETGWAWAPTTHGTVSPNGSFSAAWKTNHIGRFVIRAVIRGTARAAAASPIVSIIVYRPALATLYGPGFWGQQTACGQILRRTTLGVANRTLKCGTPVAIYYNGRAIVVPVIDRGPYANGADWDLTMATASALRMTGTDTIGAVSLPTAP